MVQGQLLPGSQEHCEPGQQHGHLCNECDPVCRGHSKGPASLRAFGCGLREPS